MNQIPQDQQQLAGLLSGAQPAPPPRDVSPQQDIERAHAIVALIAAIRSAQIAPEEALAAAAKLGITPEDLQKLVMEKDQRNLQMGQQIGGPQDQGALPPESPPPTAGPLPARFGR